VKGFIESGSSPEHKIATKGYTEFDKILGNLACGKRYMVNDRVNHEVDDTVKDR
jgi:hypothetical protein